MANNELKVINSDNNIVQSQIVIHEWTHLFFMAHLNLRNQVVTKSKQYGLTIWEDSFSSVSTMISDCSSST